MRRRLRIWIGVRRLRWLKRHRPGRFAEVVTRRYERDINRAASRLD